MTDEGKLFCWMMVGGAAFIAVLLAFLEVAERMRQL